MVSPRESLNAVAESMEKVQTLRARCDIAFTDATGETIRFDGAVIARFPHRFRVQAWKFDRTVVDVTCVGGEVFSLPDSGDTPGSAAAQLAKQTPARIARSLTPFTHDFWTAAEPIDDLCTPTMIVARSRLGPGDEVLCFVDRRTLVPVRLEPANPEFDRIGEYFALADYRIIDGVAWPMRWVFGGARGMADIRFSEIEFHAELDEDAFVPSRRAVKLP